MQDWPDCDPYSLEVRPYERPFATALQTSWGKWSVRKGEVIRLQDATSGRCGFGEAAPLPDAAGHGTKGSAQGEARAFAVWSARESMKTLIAKPVSVRIAGLLSLDSRTGERMGSLRQKGIRTFKLKMGVRKPVDEWTHLQSLVTRMQSHEQLRLDPNRAWGAEEWKFWQPRLNGISSVIQYLEEPFSEDFASREKMMTLADRTKIPIALDECLCPESIEKWIRKGWPGYWIIKPSIMRNPRNWMRTLSGLEERVILSSSFETGVGMSAIIRLARSFPDTDHGLGTQAWFGDDGLRTREEDGLIYTLTRDEEMDLWEQLSKD